LEQEMSREIPPEKRAAALNDRRYAAFNDGLELIAIQAGYRFGWYSGLAQHGPCTANQLSAFTGTGARFTREWLRQQTAAGILDADISGIEPTFRLSPEIAAALLGASGTEQNTLAAMTQRRPNRSRTGAHARDRTRGSGRRCWCSEPWWC
jgi:hypothetical protein